MIKLKGVSFFVCFLVIMIIYINKKEEMESCETR